MSILSPSILFLCPSKPQQPSPPLKPKPNNTFSSSCKLFTSQNPHLTTQSIASAPVLADDWPQLLQLSIGSRDLKLGLSIHAFLIKLGSQNEAFQGNNLINLYSKFNRLNDAQRVFEEMPVRNTITWTSLMNGYSQNNNDFESVFRIAYNMHRSGEVFSEHTCTVILHACGSPKDQTIGEQVHSLVIKSGFEKNVFLGTSLLSMYLRSGSLGNAENVFKGLDDKDIQCLNAMILGYGKEGDGEKSIQLFGNLLNYGLEPNDYTFTNVISSSCSGEIGLREGRQLHGLAIKHGFVNEISVGNAVVTMYGKHGLVEEAEKMFFGMGERNLVSWTALLSVYAKNSNGEKAINGFLEMLHLGIWFDSSCLATVIDGCSECKNLKFGLQIHGFVTKLGYLSDVFVATTLIDLYARCGNLHSARLVFNNLSVQNIAFFNAILVGYSEMDEDEEEDSMVLFNQLRSSGVEPDSITFARLIGLSADQASLIKGKALHGYAINIGLEAEIIVSNAVITMYAKCGKIEDSRRMFYRMVFHDLVSWNSMISGCALHGQGKEALLLFEEMRNEGFSPDEITVLSVLQACCYSGLYEDGIRLFEIMESRFGIKPVIEHYSCMVDLLGRSGNLSKAMDFIKGSPFSESTLLWRTLINASNLRRDVKFSTLASKHLLDLVPNDAGSYILVSNMYAGGGMFDDAAKVRTIMNNRRMKKDAGCSWIEIENTVHCFFASGKDHQASSEIYMKLDELRSVMQVFDSEIEPLQTWEMEFC
ncbi:Pentatricopeptide repeat [Macleaya cordata]|uniref:Pentatricopeptide repeat n=1 Tax=Macleaya cordata TaxID=56857 RepID=A0A200R0Z2_MACCD|nr:Pentatricopeptide repeat [Macleaya cordata]